MLELSKSYDGGKSAGDNSARKGKKQIKRNASIDSGKLSEKKTNINVVDIGLGDDEDKERTERKLSKERRAA